MLLNDNSKRLEATKESINFWDKRFKNIKPKDEVNKIYEISDELKRSFLNRIREANSIFLLFFIRFLSFKYFFGDIVIHLKDTNETFILNFFKITKISGLTKSQIDIEMLSRRFFFLIKFPYGIDTLSSNGCLFENKKNSFEKMIRSIGFVSLNQTNNGITLKSIFSRNILNKILSIFVRLKLKNS